MAGLPDSMADLQQLFQLGQQMQGRLQQLQTELASRTIETAAVASANAGYVYEPYACAPSRDVPLSGSEPSANAASATVPAVTQVACAIVPTASATRHR